MAQINTPDKTAYTIGEIVPGVTSIDDYSDATCYLIEGGDKDLLIDTGWGAGDFKGLVQGLTKKPVELAVTHAHGDHMMHAHLFETVYLHEADVQVLPEMNARFKDFMQGNEVDPAQVTPLRDGDRIDLGGGVVVEVLLVAGHTPGSVAFADAFHGVIFTGDAIGSGAGVWMQVPCGLTLEDYRQQLLRFAAKLETYGEQIFCGGHIGQSGVPGEAGYNPLTKQTVKDMIILIEKIKANTVESQSFSIPGRDWEEPPFMAQYGTAGIVYLKGRV